MQLCGTLCIFYPPILKSFWDADFLWSNYYAGYWAHKKVNLEIIHYEIIALKITLKVFVTLKTHINHTEKYLQRKPQW